MLTSAPAHNFVLNDNNWNTNYCYWFPFAGSETHTNQLFRFRLEFASTAK